MTRRPTGTLKRGWSTGACATAATHAAYEALLTGRFPDPVTITLPRGERPSFPLAVAELAEGRATAGIVKDAGDDPDVTHRALVRVAVTFGPPGAGVSFRAGEGVGTVTRAGLAIPVGEPAINPVPRSMMRGAIAEVAEAFGAGGDVEITVAIPGGEELAKKTTNARLGIVGGLSILGTTGIVIPYSCSSWIASIHRGIDVARAAGLTHVAGATGRTSEQAVKKMYGLADIALIDMGDFAGGMLKYLRAHPLPRVTIAGGFGKLSKLAAGHLDLHSARSRVDVAELAELAAAFGAPAELTDAARRAHSASEVLALAGDHGLPIADQVARRAREVALATLAGGIAVDVAIFDRAGRLVGHADP
ncbi:MAG: cobalt-precorrin-5B (C(1))-methyltransferase [Proteobacteria bacterium]|nr:cobalt-precorrin-5B (C(1))-methyltransferase [Pseudomonadota bacterium]